MGEPFRKCRVCGAEWHTHQEFLLDRSLSVIGLQAIPKIPTASVLVFNHNRCGSISVLTSKLRAILDLPGPSEKETEPCEGCFRDLDELADCDRPCTIACDRHLTRVVLAIKRGERSP